jgi:hypothetical protein
MHSAYIQNNATCHPDVPQKRQYTSVLNKRAIGNTPAPIELSPVKGMLKYRLDYSAVLGAV